MNIKTIVSILMLGLFSYIQPTYADGRWINCSRTNGYYQYYESTTVQIGKDAKVGDLLGTWVSSINPTAWTCSHRESYKNNVIPLTVQGYPPYTVWGTLNVDGQNYNVYNAVTKRGLGYIARWRYNVKGTVSDWVPLTVRNGVYQTPSQFVNIKYDSSNPTWNLGVDVQVRFVKTADTLTAGNVGLFDPMYMRHYQTFNGNDDAGTGTYMIAQFKAGNLGIITDGGTCTTPNVNVELPLVSRSEFKNIGYTAARTDFSLKLNECPQGLSSISYYFEPTTTILDKTNGVFAMASSSTASGVGLQLLNENDVPITFNTAYLLSDYDPNKNKANYSVPLRAGIYQTENNVSSGTVSSAVTFTIVYK
ncbi:TPA: fimbrial protein [Enterobacter hormaechei]